jgi:hypothetical protein
MSGCTVLAHGDLVRNFSMSFCDQSAGFFSFHTSPAQAALAKIAIPNMHVTQSLTLDFMYELLLQPVWRGLYVAC